MFSVIQTNFIGIDGLTYQQIQQPELTDNGVIIKMSVLPVTPADWKRESDPAATNEQLSALPHVIGIGGVGKIVAVGSHRDPRLLNQRVLVINPQGTYSEYVLSTNPDTLFTLPDAVSDPSAAALIAGPGTALVLKRVIELSEAVNVIVTGANSVIGLYLLQLLGRTNKKIWPIVSADSQSYFQTELPNWQSVTADELRSLKGSSLILDIAGSERLLTKLADRSGSQTEIVSIALMQFATQLPFKFVHEEFDPAEYRQFIQKLATGRLIAPIDRIFPVTETKNAQHYAQESHSRGRVLVEFNH